MSDRTHSFHIPVMGTAFTIDTPLKVARYGISSVISLVDDVLIEQMRKFHSDRNNLPYEPITDKDPDPRANRITAYLNMIHDLITEQVEKLRAEPFAPGSDITRYFEMLEDGPVRQKYLTMLDMPEGEDQTREQDELRKLVKPGSIDVNIMTKVDRDNYKHRKLLPPEFSDALAALRGFANSRLQASIIFSAGFNQRLYGYINKFKDFLPNAAGEISKKVILKVSDYRSSIIQGKFLAKRGIWVSEYRVESGLNCGGHAFASDGYLMGPILDEFRNNMEDLARKLTPIYRDALTKLGLSSDVPEQDIRLTVQGGIGTAAEDRLLRNYYGVSGTGWGTPFLLCPDVTTLDQSHIDRLCEAGHDDVHLSDSSPLGIPFWNLKASDSELEREKRIADGKPGSPCPKGFLVSDTEFTDMPICPASRGYQRRKLKQLATEFMDDTKRMAVETYVKAKSCICHDLAGSATLLNKIEDDVTPSVCCGPNIVNFDQTRTLDEMTDHIYGRNSFVTDPERPHMFMRELRLYVDYLLKEIDKVSAGLSTQSPRYFETFKNNLLKGTDYYRTIVDRIDDHRDEFIQELSSIRKELETIPLPGTSLEARQTVA